MTDYYPLISRAIAALDPGAPGETRGELYARERASLIERLRSSTPLFRNQKSLKSGCPWKRLSKKQNRKPPHSRATLWLKWQDG
jgi:hypothetical protein